MEYINKIQTLLFILCISITFSSYSQECNSVLFMKEGTTLEYTNYNKNEKKEGSSIHETVTVTGSNNSLTAVIKATAKDKKNQEIFNAKYNANCNDGLLSLDMIRFFNFDKLSEHHKSNLSLKIDGDILEFPLGMKPGDQLNDGTITIKVNSESFTLVTMSFKVFNRKILGEEQVTTPAGSFMCKKVTFDFESKFGIINIKGTGKEWYHNDAVVIRSESYNKKGKLLDYRELTGIQ